MGKRILIIDGHPDPSPERLCHALADAYAKGAAEAGHEARRIAIAGLDIGFLRSAGAFDSQVPPPWARAAQEAIVWTEHLLIVHPLWHAAMPALLKAFVEQVMRRDFAMEARPTGLPKGKLGGRSARLVVTMGMPALAYRWLFGAMGVRGFERGVLRLAGIRPIRRTLLGGVEQADAGRRQAWLEEMTNLGRQAR